MTTIMIVDDASFMRMILKEVLENAGNKVITEAINGIEAIEKYRAFRPDIVMMDYSMPEMDGIHALKEIILIDPLAKVIMCSAFGNRDIIIDTALVGAKDYILKPFNSNRVLDAIQRSLQPLESITN